MISKLCILPGLKLPMPKEHFVKKLCHMSGFFGWDGLCFSPLCKKVSEHYTVTITPWC